MQLDGYVPLHEAEAQAAAGLPPLPFVKLHEWADAPTPERRWIVRDWIPDRQVTYLTGPGSAGKSLLTQLLCTSVAAGKPFMGISLEQWQAWYITCEDDADELHRRQKAICDGLGVSLAALSGPLRIASLVGETGNELATFTPEGRLIRSPSFGRLRDAMLRLRPRLVVLDNVAHLFAGNENIRNQVAAFIGLLNALATEADCAILLLGHPNKAGDAYSGSTAWENQVRSRLFLNAPKDDKGEVLDPDARVLSRGKANYARNGETIAFRWHAGTFISEQDVPADVWEETAANVQAGHDNDVFLACLRERAKQGRAVSERPSRTYAPAVFAEMPEARGISKKRLEAAMDRLFRLERIERAVVGRDQAKRRDIEGLREVAPTTDPSAPNPRPERRPNPAHNGAPNPPQTVTRTPPPPYPSPTEREGVAPKGHAPSPAREADWHEWDEVK